MRFSRRLDADLYLPTSIDYTLTCDAEKPAHSNPPPPRPASSSDVPPQQTEGTLAAILLHPSAAAGSPEEEVRVADASLRVLEGKQAT